MRKEHRIRFRKAFTMIVHPPQGSKELPTKNKIQVGDEMDVMLQPISGGEIECADLALPGGGEATKVPYEYFEFV